MTFSKVKDSRIIKRLYQSVYYHQNRHAIQAQQRTYRESNKQKVKTIWTKASKRYRDDNREYYNMYAQLIRQVRNDGML